MNLQDYVKQFFDTAVIIDDELAGTEAGAEQGEYHGVPQQLVNAFQSAGVVITPLPYRKPEDVDTAVRLALRSKLIILDWELERTGLVGGVSGLESFTSREVIRRILEERTDMGMRWLVVYSRYVTAKLPRALVAYLKQNWDGSPHLLTQLEEAHSQWEKDASVPVVLNGVFLTFMSKQDVTPERLLERFTKTLERVFGPMSLVVLAMAGEMERLSYAVLREFAHPFDLSVRLQALTSEFLPTDTARFLFRLYSDALIHSMNLTPFADIIEQFGKDNAQQVLEMIDRDSKTFTDLLERLSANGNPLRIQGSWKWKEALESYINGGLSEEQCDLFGIHKKKQYRGFLAATEILGAFGRWRERNPDGTPDEFFDDLRLQAALFTKLLKYEWRARTQSEHPPVDTGDIYYDEASDTYLLCITPYCDTVRPKKVDNHFKFICGKPVPPVSHDDISEVVKSAKEHGTFVPLENGRVEFVRWEFYKTQVIKLEELNRLRHSVPAQVAAEVAAGKEPGSLPGVSPHPGGGRYRFIARMKKEYVQQIINKYLAYHSRAGVSELYYKEWAELHCLFHG